MLKEFLDFMLFAVCSGELVVFILHLSLVEIELKTWPDLPLFMRMFWWSSAHT